MYEKICAFDNIYKGFKIAIKGRQYAPSVLKFRNNLEDHLIKIREELLSGSFVPLAYNHFTVYEPKERNIAAPAFRDIVTQHAICNIINPVFEKRFVYDSYACRRGKGSHFGIRRVKKFLQASRSYYGKNQPIYYLKCDIAKYFPSINWDVLLGVISKSISCPKTIGLLEKIVTNHLVMYPSMQTSLCKTINLGERRGLPIGNLTSQIFANIYMNEFDHFVKEKLKVRWYGRYMDDFVIIDGNKDNLKKLKAEAVNFLAEGLKLTAHPNKTFIGNAITGIDFLGYRVFYDHVLIRAKTLRNFNKRYKIKIRKFQKGKIDQEVFMIAQSSFAGHMKHADTYWLRKSVFGDMNIGQNSKPDGEK